MAYPEVVLKRGRERRILEGHPWVFDGAVAERPASAEPGGIVDVLDGGRRFVGRGTYNPTAAISVRVMTRDPAQRIDRAFLVARIRHAWDLRRAWLDGRATNAYRVVHGEGDYLPGLIVDRYADFLVVQFHTLGMETFRDLLVDALQEVVGPTGIYERSDVGTRRAERMETFPAGVLVGADPPELIEVMENRLKFRVDVRRGQKTGFFLDQRENRLAVQALARDREVLNCFSYSGGFSVYAARGKARRTVSVDVSESAVELARQNLALNRFDAEAHPCVTANVFDYLKACRRERRQFDLVIADPPVFVKRQKAVERTVRTYISLNRRAMEVLRPGGILVTASCSTQVDYGTFRGALKHAAAAARREFQVVKTHLQSADHPVPAPFPEGQYLKCFFGIVR